MIEPGSFSCGHPKTQLNSYVRHSGPRRGQKTCATCRKDQRREYVQRLKSGVPGKPNYQASKTHCPRGHEYTPENTQTSKFGWRQCKACKHEYNKSYHATFRRHALLRKYRLTRKQYSDLLVSQDGLCAICYDQSATQVDHDHQTGRVRGLLCGNCNKALGLLKDNAENLEFAAQYLSEVA